MIAPDLDAIPISLANLDRWLLWRAEIRKGKQTKVPRTIGGALASSIDAGTWSGFRPVTVALGRQPESFDGLGIALGDLGDGEHQCGADFDSCLDDQGNIADWARPIVDCLLALGAYLEFSPSGRGLKAFFRCSAIDASDLREAFCIEADCWGCKRSIPGAANGKEHGPAIEVYLGDGRYFTVTGRHWPTSSVDVVLLDRDTLLRIAALVRQATAAPAAKAKGKDQSRSAIAFRKGAELRRRGKTFEEMCTALRDAPETADWVRAKGHAHGGRELRRIWDRAGNQAALADVDLTEDGIASIFAQQFDNRLRYCHDHGSWFEWDGNIWRQETTELAFHWCRHTCRQVGQSVINAKLQATVRRASTAGAVERFARADRTFAVNSTIWDRDPFSLGTPAGTVDLRTGVLRTPLQTDYITKSTTIAPAEVPDCPLWLQFLEDATRGDDRLVRYLRQWCGYCLTGDIREHALLFIFGPGGNGKSVFLNTVSRIMGDYATIAAMNTFVASKSERHPADLAMLRGARLVSVSETEEGHAWAENRIKTLTGGDAISARFMRQDFFTYQPQFKITIIGNHKPVLHSVDDAVRRRFNIAPFVHKPTVPDKALEQTLVTEHPAILRWMIEGCLDWQMHGLSQPSAVTSATLQYFAEEDTLRQWIEECCEVSSNPPHVADTNASLFASWRNWCASHSEETGSQKGFSRRLHNLGCLSIKDEHEIRGRGFLGIKVRIRLYPDADQ